MKNKTDFSIGIGILVFCTVMLQQIMLLPAPAGSELFSARSFPLGIDIFLFILSALLVYSSFKTQKVQSEWPENAIRVRIGLMALSILGYVLFFIFAGDLSIQNAWPIGTVFAVSTFLFLMIAQLVTGYKNWVKIFLIAIITTIFFYFIFVHFFKVPLP
mgnify:FL=1